MKRKIQKKPLVFEIIVSEFLALSLIFYKNTYLGPSLCFKLFLESHKPTELVQTLTVAHIHKMQRDFPYFQLI